MTAQPPARQVPAQQASTLRKVLRVHPKTLLAIILAAGAFLTACNQDADVATCHAERVHPQPGPMQAASTRFTFPPTAMVGDIHLTELSGLAWDADEELLYAVSDTGYVFHFRLTLDGDAIADIQPIRAAPLADPHLAGGTPEAFNAEGLTLVNATNGIPGDTELIASLEGTLPKIVRFSPDGTVLGNLPVPPPADDLNNYRKKGRGLESLAIHPAHGLITAPESPLLQQPQDQHALYAIGGHWSFVRQAPDSRLKGMDVLPDGSLLVLERSRQGAKDALSASVRRVDLSNCTRDQQCASQTIIVLPVGPDNIEGMTLLDARHVLLASDNGGLVTHGTTFVLLTRP